MLEGDKKNKIRETTNVKLSWNLNSDFLYAWHALYYSVILPMVFGSCNYLFISKPPPL